MLEARSSNGGDSSKSKKMKLSSPRSSVLQSTQPDSNLQERPPTDRKKSLRRKSGFSVRLRREGVVQGKRSGPSTPLLRWKCGGGDDDGNVSVSGDHPAESVLRGRRRKVTGAGGDASVSARKLAAGLWHLQLLEVHNSGGDGGSGDLKNKSSNLFKGRAGNVGVRFHCHHNGRDFGTETNNLLQTLVQKNGFLYKVDPSLPFPNSAMEGATKWDPVCSKTSDEVYRFYGNMKLLEDQQIATVSVVSELQSELEQARTRISELETERRSSKKKLEHFLRKLAEEKAAWRSREHEKIRAIMNDMKDDLNRERKNRQRMEIVNSKLVNELAEVKLSAKRFMQDYEKEIKARELMEEVCDELAKDIGEDKTEVETLKRESMKFREEVEEERKMLQMAEVWREERVQMKLVDAKLTVEEKYSQMSKLIADLEAFLSSRSATPDVNEMRQAQLLLEAASLLKIHDMKFSYEPPNSEDIFSVFEDLQAAEANEREIEQSHGNSPASHVSMIHTVSPDSNRINTNHAQRCSNGFINQTGDLDDDGSGWETVSQVEEQGSSYSPDGSRPSVSRTGGDSNVSRRSRKDWEENAGHDSPNSEISEVCSISARQSQSKKKGSSISRLWRSNGENYKLISVEGMKGRLSNGRLSSVGVMSPDLGSVESGLSPRSLMGHWSSPDFANPHINRGMKGCIEWPRGAQKNSLKSKLMEARMESQKIQLRQVLKQKI